MKKLMMAVIALAITLLVPSAARAHEGHVHRAMGTIASVQGSNVMVKTTDGKTMMVMLDAKTKITRGKDTLSATALKVGERVVAEGPEHNEMIMATSVRLGTAAPARAKK